MTSAPHSKNPVSKFVSLAYDFFAQYFFPCMQFPSVFGANAQTGSRLREKTEVTEEREDNSLLQCASFFFESFYRGWCDILFGL